MNLRRTFALAAALLVATTSGCRSRGTLDPGPRATAGSTSPSASATRQAPLADLSVSLEPARAAFNARKKQARFLSLLSPA